MRRFVPLFLLVSVCLAGGCAGRPSPDESADVAAATIVADASPPQPMDFGPVVVGTAPLHDYSEPQIARGEYLVRFGACDDCHTPWNYDPAAGGPVPDMQRRLSGHPRLAPDPYSAIDARDAAVIGPSLTSFRMPFGVTYALNLTPDVDTGIGSWSEEMFVKIFREAKHMGGNGRTVLPPMPWAAMATLDGEDLVSIFAYLRSITPIRNAVPSAKVPPEVIDAIGRANDELVTRMKAEQR